MTDPEDAREPTMMDEMARHLGINTALVTCLMVAVQANPQPDALVGRIDEARADARADVLAGTLDAPTVHQGIDDALVTFEKMLTRSTAASTQGARSADPEDPLGHASRMVGLNYGMRAALRLAVETNPHAGLLRLLQNQLRVMIEGRLLEIAEETVWDGVDQVLEEFDDMLPPTPAGADIEAALDSLGPAGDEAPETAPRKAGAPEVFSHLVGQMVALPMVLQAAVGGHPRPALLLERLDDIRRDARDRLGDTGNDWGAKAIEKILGDLELGLRGRRDVVATDFGEGAPDLTQPGEPQEKMNASFAWMMGQVRAIEVALEVCVATNPATAAVHASLTHISKDARSVLDEMDEQDETQSVMARFGAESAIQKFAKLLSSRPVA